MKHPQKSLLNPNFRYVPAAKTNIRATFRRVKAEMERQQQHEEYQNRMRQVAHEGAF